MTSVRFFDRDDEENETPTPEELASRVGNVEDSEEKIVLLGFSQLEDSKVEDEGDREDREGESDDEERVDMRRSFLRPIESPSSGSAFGSATSNDEDNFFGPVSASFIRPDRLSDSGASDVEHDVTLDSTAFSMHFQSLARSDSGVDLKTPTISHLSFEEKTPTQTNLGSSMELTVPKKLISQSSSSFVNGGGRSCSSDMTLVGGSPHNYDYGRLSPELEALLSEGSKNWNVISDSNIDVPSRSPRNFGSKFFAQRDNGSDLMDINKNGKAFLDISGEENGGFPISPVACGTCDLLSNTSNKLLDILIDKTNISPNQSSKKGTCQSCSELGQADRYIPNESPLADFISSSPSKQRELLMGSASPLKHVSVLTPREQRGSFRCKETIEHATTSSIQKSISKLKLLEASPFSSSLTAENRNIRPYDFSKSSPIDIFSEKEMNNFQTKHLDASSSGTNGQLLSDSRGEGALVSTSTAENYCTEDQLNRGHLRQSEVFNAAAVSPSQLIFSGETMKHDPFRSKDRNDNTLVTAGIDCSSAGITLDYFEENKSTGIPQVFVPSPDKWLQKKLTASPELQNKLSIDLVLHDRFVKLKNSCPGRNFASDGSASDEKFSTAPLDRLGSSSMGRRVRSSSPALEVSSSNLVQVNSTVGRDDGDRGIEMIEGSQFIHTRKLDGNLQSGAGLANTRNELSGGRTEAEAAASDSSAPSVLRNLKELTCQKNLLDSLTQSPSRKMFQLVDSDNICLRDVEDVLAPTSNQLKSPLKRRNEVFNLEDREYRNEVVAEQRSPKLRKVGYQDIEMLGCTNEDCGERSVVPHALMHWTDIYSKFSGYAERLFAPSMDKLNLSVIDLFEDFLFQLKTSGTYEMLCKEILAQKTPALRDHCCERVGETRLLLHQIMHEKAKLQLMRVKQQRLLGKLQQLSLGIQEAQMLKLNFSPKLKRYAQADVLGLQNFVSMKQRDECQDGYDKVTAMKQTLEALDEKKAEFTKALQTSCKSNGGPSCPDIVLLVSNQLMRRSHYRFICQDMQMWVVDDVKHRNGHYDIVLNYLGLIVQRVKLIVGFPSSIVISNKLDDTKIMKNFPNLDACKAFSVVLHAGTTRKYLDSRSLAQEMQVTSSLLGNLVDVIWELQMAQIELQNLTETTFQCPLDGKLNLHLSFFSFKNGKKVSLMLDMSSLNRGIYPSDIIPSQLRAFNGMNNTSVDPIIGEIRDAVKILRTGYMRILRLCRCISLVVQDLFISLVSTTLTSKPLPEMLLSMVVAMAILLIMYGGSGRVFKSKRKAY
ncbi:hypothetical protein ACH5RR_037046 [Cinchona calisaya]|uniref:Knl1 C-terminal RWD domain-containing protein n=1 Tax=Cinchona calisaya TaxID=153742 RepID=A0ABD2Y844_9GENT